MGNDTGQWRAAIGTFAFISSSNLRPNRKKCDNGYPYNCGANVNPPDVEKGMNQLFRFKLLASLILPTDASERKLFFNCLVSRLLLLVAGIERNPGPDQKTLQSTQSTSGTGSGNGAKGKRGNTKPITDFFFKKLKTSVAGGGADRPSSTTDACMTSACQSNASTPSCSSSSDTSAAAALLPLLNSDVDLDATFSPPPPAPLCSDLTPPPLEGAVSAVGMVHKHDIGNFVNNDSPIDDFTKFQLLESPWTPDDHYKFPFSTHTKGGKEIRQYASAKHLKSIEWLAFSQSYRGYFCKYCVLFAKDASNADRARNSLGSLVKTPVTQFSKLFGSDGCLTRHGNFSYHKQAVLAAADFKKIFKAPTLEIVNQLNSKRANQVEENRRRLRPIVETIILCGQQNIPLRGHRDDGRLEVDDSKNTSVVSVNDGNFRSLLRYRVAGGDTALADHLSKAGANATYVGKNTQNELINCCGDEVLEILCERVRKAKWFAIIFDETTDVSRKEQLSLSVRYIHGKQSREDFLTFADCYVFMRPEDVLNGEKRLTGVALAHIVIDICKKFGFDLNYLVGIGTDNCSVMASDVKGAVQEIRKFAPGAVRCPCLNHSLNNSLKQCHQIICCKSATAKMKEVIAFSNSSAKITDVFKRILGRSFSGLCETRWQEKHDGVLQFRTSLPLICDALEEVSGWSSDTAARAHSLLQSLLSSDFIMSTFVLSDVLGVTRSLSTLLQMKTLDSVGASNAVTDVIAVLQRKRDAADLEFTSLFQAANEVAGVLDVVLSPPRTAARQRFRDNHPASSAEEFYRRSVYIPLLDVTLQDLRNRLSEGVLDSFDLRMLMPSSPFMNMDHGPLSAECKAKLDILRWRPRVSSRGCYPVGVLSVGREVAPTTCQQRWQ